MFQVSLNGILAVTAVLLCWSLAGLYPSINVRESGSFNLGDAGVEDTPN